MTAVNGAGIVVLFGRRWLIAIINAGAIGQWDGNRQRCCDRNGEEHGKGHCYGRLVVGGGAIGRVNHGRVVAVTNLRLVLIIGVSWAEDWRGLSRVVEGAEDWSGLSRVVEGAEDWRVVIGVRPVGRGRYRILPRGEVDRWDVRAQNCIMAVIQHEDIFLHRWKVLTGLTEHAC